MPDWLIHMGATHAVSGPLRRLDPRWLLLGAVLPDVVPRVAGSAIATMSWLEPLRNPTFGLYLSFLHTPFSVLLLLATLVVLARDRLDAARGLMFGAVLHFLLDLAQRTYGGGLSLLYPFDLRPFSFQLVWYENPATYFLAPAMGIYLLVLMVVRRGADREPVLRGRSLRGLLGAGLALVVTFATPVFCLERAVELNLNCTRLATNPELFENLEVAMPVALVAEVNEDWVQLESNDVRYAVPRSSLPDVEVKDRASVKGIYRDGKIEPIATFVHDYSFKRAVSIAGLLLLLTFWFPVSWLRRWQTSRS